MEFEILNHPDVFLYGLSGSGKDTIANYLRDEYGYLKMRLAKTIKQIICETNNIEFDMLDIQKRTNPELRIAHWEMGKILDNISQQQTGKDHSLNRLNHILNKTSIEFEILKCIDELPVVICDTRIQDEIETILNFHKELRLKHNTSDPMAVGIFLAKNPEEFVGDGKHKTEQNFFQNGLLEKWIEKYSGKVPLYLIFNNNYSDKDLNFLKEYWGKHTDNIYFPGTNIKKILEIVDGIINYKI